MHEEEGKAPLSKEEGGGSVALQSERKEKEKKGKGNWRTAYSPSLPPCPHRGHFLPHCSALGFIGYSCRNGGIERNGGRRKGKKGKVRQVGGGEGRCLPSSHKSLPRSALPPHPWGKGCGEGRGSKVRSLLFLFPPFLSSAPLLNSGFQTHFLLFFLLLLWACVEHSISLLSERRQNKGGVAISQR